jgi:diacylglycerol kinase (ATP)
LLLLNFTNEPKRIFLNSHCNYGTGNSRWAKVKDEIYKRIGKFELEGIKSPDNLVVQVSEATSKGEMIFIAAGGDGTVNLLLNAIMKLDDSSNILIGAVGLGSSNDFHKPFRTETFVKGIPVRIDFGNAILCDVIRVDYQDIKEQNHTHFCLLNASIGVTAEANAFFNLRTKFIGLLQKVSINAAIIATALRTILAYHNIPCQLIIENREEEEILLTNLGVIKSPHFTGSLCYDTPISPDDGQLGVNLCYDMSLWERIGILSALSNHHFQGRPKTKTWLAKRLSLKSEKAFALEMDGEVVQTKSVEFSVMPKKVRCCR